LLRLALDFYRQVFAACRDVSRSNHTIDQLLRAAESTVLNIGEANPATGADRVRRFRIASDEATEAGSALDLIEINGLLPGQTVVELMALSNRVQRCLWPLAHPRK
jgi:four helix bundle protein